MAGSIQPDEVLGEEVPGIRLVFVGDAGRVDNLVAHVAGADLLAIEATYIEEERDVAAAFGHLTAKQAAWLAREAGVKHLVLHHISRRYNAKQILEEARSGLPRYVGRARFRPVPAGEAEAAGAGGRAWAAEDRTPQRHRLRTRPGRRLEVRLRGAGADGHVESVSPA